MNQKTKVTVAKIELFKVDYEVDLLMKEIRKAKDPVLVPVRKTLLNVAEQKPLRSRGTTKNCTLARRKIFALLHRS